LKEWRPSRGGIASKITAGIEFLFPNHLSGLLHLSDTAPTTWFFSYRDSGNKAPRYIVDMNELALRKFSAAYFSLWPTFVCMQCALKLTTVLNGSFPQSLSPPSAAFGQWQWWL
jgi:hypothetical protein